MAEAARDTAARWQSIAARGEPSDVGEEMMRLTRTVVLRALLGADLGPFTATIDHAWTVINQQIGESFWSLGFTDWLPTAKHRQFQAARAVLRGAVDHVISQRRNNPSADGDLLSMLLSARDEETGEAMTDEQLRVEVTTFLLAGQETTSLALTWTWYLLSQNAAAQRRLEQEIDTVLDGRPPEYADLVNLPYTRMVIDESMRLYPPAWGFSRQALSDDELGGFHLPRGWLAFVIPYVLHRLPAYWQDPDAFDPERFLPERSADRPKFAYLPFGAGPRQCIGNQFALIEAQLIVATLVQGYRLHLVPGTRVEPWALITLRPRFGMPMMIERRAPWPIAAAHRRNVLIQASSFSCCDRWASRRRSSPATNANRGRSSFARHAFPLSAPDGAARLPCASCSAVRRGRQTSWQNTGARRSPRAGARPSLRNPPGPPLAA